MLVSGSPNSSIAIGPPRHFQTSLVLRPPRFLNVNTHRWAGDGSWHPGSGVARQRGVELAVGVVVGVSVTVAVEVGVATTVAAGVTVGVRVGSSGNLVALGVPVGVWRLGVSVAVEGGLDNAVAVAVALGVSVADPVNVTVDVAVVVADADLVTVAVPVGEAVRVPPTQPSSWQRPPRMKAHVGSFLIWLLHPSAVALSHLGTLEQTQHPIGGESARTDAGADTIKHAMAPSSRTVSVLTWSPHAPPHGWRSVRWNSIPCHPFEVPTSRTIVGDVSRRIVDPPIAKI